MFQLELYLSPHASLARTEQRVKQLDSELRSTDGIESVNWVIGGNVPSFYYNLTQKQQGASQYAQAMVRTRDFRTANRLIPELQQRLDKDYPDAQILVRKLEQGPPFNAPVELRLYGPNLDRLAELGDEVRRMLAETRDVIHTRQP